MKTSSEHRSAFTIIELLVVVVMVAIFGTLLLPALALDQRSHTMAVRCLANHSQLIKAWQIYANDFDGYVANNYTIPGVQYAMSKCNTTGACDAWAPNIMSFSVTSSDSVTNTALAQAGLLVPYHKDINAYRCPADNFLSRVQKSAGWKRRARSISMNSNWGRTDPTDSKNGLPTSWAYGAPFRQWHKLVEVRKPSDRYVFVDEHADSINDGFFIMGWGSGSGEYPATSPGAQWGDIPGFYHHNSTPFGFADGHTEMKMWLSRPIPVRADGTFTSGTADIRDQRWYVQHVAER